MTTAPRLSKKGMQVMIYLQPEQKQKLALLGGSKFVQAAIEDAFDEFRKDENFIEEAVQNPAFAGKLWVVVDMKEAECMTLYLDRREAEKEAERLGVEWNEYIQKKIEYKEELFKEIDEDDLRYIPFEKQIASNKHDYERLNPRYVVFDTEDFANHRDKKGENVEIDRL